MRSDDDRMKCPKCGRFELKEGEGGIVCKVCGYQLSPGEADKFRLFKLLRDEAKEESKKQVRRLG